MTDRSPQKTILITGCSSGIGLDSARRFQDMGWLVLATCRKDEDCQRLREEGLTSFRLDYEDPASIQSGFDEAMSPPKPCGKYLRPIFLAGIA
jgi:NAD(P)-dependent dehydrogenase (short-subunit alcohol dehydrogenase family)